MYLPLLMLLEKAGIFLPAETAHSVQSIMLRDIRLLTPELTEYQAHTLYVGQTPPPSLPSRTKQETWCILLFCQTGKDAEDPPANSAVSEDSENTGFSGIRPVTAPEDLFVLFNRMLEIMDRFRSFRQRLEQPGYSENQKERLQEMTELISGMMGNPAYLTDSSFKALAIDSSPLFSEISSIWRHLSRYGYLPYDIVYNLQKSGELEEIEQTDRALLFRSAYFNNPFIGYCLKHNEQLYGYLFVVGYRKKITPGEILFAEQIGKAVMKSILHTARPAASYRRDYENFFIHALDGNFHDTIQIARQLKPLRWNLNGSYCVLRLDTALEDETLHRHLCVQLEHLEQVIPLIYDNGVTAVCALDSSHTVTELIRHLQALLEPQNCICGISDKFTGFQNLHSHYKQAEAALKECRDRQTKSSVAGDRKDCAVITYTECAARYLLRDCPQEAVAAFRWEVLDDLIRYDRLHHTSYVQTLACYLHCERNLALTSKKLYIHRNTLIYRISRLSRLLDCDLENAAVRLRLTLCLEWMPGQE